MVTLVERISRWSEAPDASNRFQDLHRRLETLDELRYQQYEPTRHEAPRFFERLERCLTYLPDDEDAKAFLSLLPHILFLSREEMEALYRAAFTSTITRWLIDQGGFDLADPDLDRLVATSMEKTWCCPITDSMPISHFYHVNNLTHAGTRPDFLSLARLAEPAKTRDYLDEEGFERIVLLEDFVGTGSQMKSAVAFAAQLGRPLLVVPALACPESLTAASELGLDPELFTYEPLVVLTERSFIRPSRQPDEPDEFQTIRELMEKIHPIVSAGSEDHEARIYGFGSTGGLLVLYSNCPNNSLALIRYSSETWKPLFPRSRRE